MGKLHIEAHPVILDVIDILVPGGLAAHLDNGSFLGDG